MHTLVGSIIDSTLLRPEATGRDIINLCTQAVSCRFGAVCVNPAWVRLATRTLAGSGVRRCAVVGFPLGAATSSTKAFEARTAVGDGAQEIDMVLNIGALKGGDLRTVERDIASVARALRGKALLKVILETSLLTREEKIKGCVAAEEAGADFVKTSTGFAGGGATVEDVALMASVLRRPMGVKASGGVKDLAAALKMIAAGATRIGTSAGPAIIGRTERRGAK
ncbi:MAG: deoxyribose-phosphate aldolase [Planctomycetota bacterium]|nr:deoxyribose-phosphate aldolase [Planctomycetota bacterium]